MFFSVTIALNLSDELRKFVDEAVKSGRFSHEEDVVREALEAFRTREEFLEFQRNRIRDKLKAGLDDVEAGRVADWDSDEIIRKGRALLAERMAGT